MTDDREIIVVGAGPAGSITATLLAQDGHDVLLLDKQMFPHEKICGDAVSARVIDILEEAGMKTKIDGAISRGEFYPLIRMRFVSPKGYQLIAPLRNSDKGNNHHVAPRFYLDVLIKRHAIESGVEFRQLKAEEPLLENGRVVGVKVRNNETFENIQNFKDNSLLLRMLNTKL